MEFYPTKKGGGAENVLAMLDFQKEERQTRFEVVFTGSLRFQPYEGGGGGGRGTTS